MPSYERTKQYFLSDFPRQLFPLDTTRILIEKASPEIGKFVYERINGNDSPETFLPQVRAYSAKPRQHLRRTLKLDPIAEFFLYDLTYRHRTNFRSSGSRNRKNFGYRFAHGAMMSPAKSYRAFRAEARKAQSEYSYCLKADVAVYFNSLYHHDLVAWFREHAKSEEDVSLFGKFLREINSGRSVDCLPHGIYPCKIIGSQFLRFVDRSNRVNSHLLLRFMDDIYLFDNSEEAIKQDFQQIQRLIGEKNLSINAEKTQMGSSLEPDIEQEVDEIKTDLLERRGSVMFGSGADEDPDEDDEEAVISDEEIEYLTHLLRAPHLEEDDAELVLSVMRDHSEDVIGHIPMLLERFPSLSKNLFYFAAHVEDDAALLSILHDYVKHSSVIPEYQLFWIAKMCEQYLMHIDHVGEVLADLYEHPSATVVSRAKVLEIPEKRFGMPDLREEELRTGSSGWLSWSAAVGCRRMPKASRNHFLGYFGNASSINKLIADCVRSI